MWRVITKCQKCGRRFFSIKKFKTLTYADQELLVCPSCIKEKEKEFSLNNLNIGKKDKILLIEKIHNLKYYDNLAKNKEIILEPYYLQYISQVSNEVMAISFELSKFLFVICEIFKPKSILDLGSGFSSFVFRYYMLNSSSKPKICTVDDSAIWLEKTREFLNNQHLPTDNLTTWDSFHKKNINTFDLILHDLDGMELRKEILEEVLRLANPNGIIILDDVHFYDYSEYARKVLSKKNYNNYSLYYFTKDKFGRFSWLITKTIK